MKKKIFEGTVMSGHKDDAVEVPFDPALVWGIIPGPLWRGRRGHRVKCELNGHYFESCIVPRQKRFYLIVDKDIERATGVAEGDVVKVVVEPSLLK